MINTTSILWISIIFQIIAAIMALRLIKITGHRRGWVVIAAAIVLMAIRRGITLIGLVTPSSVWASYLGAEIMALLTSILMVAGMIWIAPIFQAFQRA